MSTTRDTFMLMFFDGLGETTTPTADFTPVSGYPLSNLTTSELFARTRTPDIDDPTLNWDFGTSISANAFALIGTNATQDVTCRFRAADNSGFTVGVEQSGTGLSPLFSSPFGTSLLTYVPPWGRTLLYIHPTSFNKRYFRWQQSDISNPDSYHEWAVARVGLGYQPEQSYDIAKAAPKYSADGQKVLRGFEVTFSLLTQADAHDLEGFALTVLKSRRFMIVLRALTPSTFLSEAIWCTLESEYMREPAPGLTSSRHKIVMTFREVDT